MNSEQRLDSVEISLRELEKTNAILQTDLKNVSQKVDENREVVKIIQQLTLNVGELTSQVKIQGEKIETVITNCNNSLKSHGERIGALESQGSKRLGAIITQTLGFAAAAGIGAFISKL